MKNKMKDLSKEKNIIQIRVTTPYTRRYVWKDVTVRTSKQGPWGDLWLLESDLMQILNPLERGKKEK